MIICEKDKCSACGLCIEICPQNVIQLKLDAFGFYYPEIDEAGCIECGQCKLSCPQNLHDTTNSILKTYTGYSTDCDLLKNSTSGGIIGALYQKILEQGGYVAGVKWDNVKSCSFFLTNVEKETREFHGSKYIGAKTQKIYNKVKDKLNANFPVIFVGTPCQCAALRSYLKRDYEQLLVVDFVCHGVSSSLVLERYIDLLEKENDKVRCYLMRSKEKGYSSKTEKIIYYGEKSLIEPFYQSVFGYPFAANLSVREGCLQCKYASTNRVSDITVGDWMVGLSEEEEQKGVSLVVVNTEKGSEIVQEISEEKRVVLKTIPCETAIRCCYRLSHKSDVPKYRGRFLSELKENKKDIKKLTRYYMRKNNLTIIQLCWKLKRLVIKN